MFLTHKYKSPEKNYYAILSTYLNFSDLHVGGIFSIEMFACDMLSIHNLVNLEKLDYPIVPFFWKYTSTFKHENPNLIDASYIFSVIFQVNLFE